MTQIKKICLGTCATLVSFFLLSHAHSKVSEEDFQKCVKVKEITLTIIEKANSGVTRSELKSRVRSSAHETIDLVYDFRGAMSDQQIAAKQMENCLKMLDVPNRK